MPPLADELELVKLDYAAKAVGKTPHNIRDYIQRGRISKYDPLGKPIKRAQNGELRVSLKELRTFLSLVEQGLDKHHEAGLHHELGFHNVPEYTRTKHVHRLHPYLGKFIPQLVEWFLSRYFKQDDIILDPFMGSGTTLIQGNEMQMHNAPVTTCGRPKMNHKALVVVLTLLALSPHSRAVAQSFGSGQPAQPLTLLRERPRVVVVLVVSGMRHDYLERHRERFRNDGFRRLVEQGTAFSDCHYPFAGAHHFQSVTSLVTGTSPSRHGVAGISWIDQATGTRQHALADEQYRLLGGVQAGTGLARHVGASPLAIVGSTIGDELKLATDGVSKVYSVQGIGLLGVGDAPLLGGKSADGAFGLDRTTGNIVSSTYYFERLPAWVEAFNQRHAIDRWHGSKWLVGDSVAVDLESGERSPGRSYYEQLAKTPFADEATMDFALELMRSEALGADAVTDMLFIYLLASDRAGHTWGSYSEEVAEIVAGADRQTARLLTFLDDTVGKDGYWVVLTSDHGMSPSRRDAITAGLHPQTIDFEHIDTAIRRAFVQRWGEADWFGPTGTGSFNRETLRQKNIGLAEAETVAGDAALTVPGVIGYVGTTVWKTDPATRRAFELWHFPGRSPDLRVITAPFTVSGEGSGHGSTYAYDTHVPLIFYGKPFPAHESLRRVSPTQLAPTLAALLRITPPTLADGAVLWEVVAGNPLDAKDLR